jgi:glycosyltransferase involved in cell wall biosynthesis
MGKAARTKAARVYNGEDDKVAVAYVHPVEVATAFHLSLLKLFLYDGANRRRITGGGGHISKYSSANISSARNDAVSDFLAMARVPEWLWFVDADMEFEPTVVDELIRSAYVDGERKADIVGGLCFGAHHGDLFATLYGLVDNDGDIRAIRYDEYPEDSMFQVAATGAACLLIHRSVLERIRDHGFNKSYPWFQETELSGRPCGEDFTFCLRAGALGIPVWVNTGVKVGHMKAQMLTEAIYAKQRAEKKAKAAPVADGEPDLVEVPVPKFYKPTLREEGAA